MRRRGWFPGLIVWITLMAACRSPPRGRPPAHAETLAEARRDFQTRVALPEEDRRPPPGAPAEVFTLVRYRSPAGDLAAYVTPRPREPGRRPAIVWIPGGFSNAIDSSAWDPAPPDNDQSARAFREAGVVLMLPSRRGANDNPGTNEGFFGEVDDVVAAADHLAGLDYVDPARVYLGGHSTGGTLALLVAARTNRFRAVFSFGPVADVGVYGEERLPLGDDPRERRLRSPVHFVGTIRSPTFVIEGVTGGNARDFPALRAAAGSAPLRFHPVAGADHFSALAPVSAVVARKILADGGPRLAITLDDDELAAACAATERYEPRDRRPVHADEPVALESVRLIDTQDVFARNIDVRVLTGHVQNIELAARRTLASCPRPFQLMVRVTLRASDRGEFQVATQGDGPRERLQAFRAAVEALEPPRTRQDPLRLELYFRVRGQSPDAAASSATR